MLDDCEAHSYVIILSHCLLEICGLYVNSIIANEGAQVKKSPTRLRAPSFQLYTPPHCKHLVYIVLYISIKRVFFYWGGGLGGYYVEVSYSYLKCLFLSNSFTMLSLTWCRRLTNIARYVW